MKLQLNGLNCAVVAALTMGLALGARAENVAEVTVGGTTTAYSDWSTAWSACTGNDATLKLLANIDLTSVLDKSWVDNGLLLDLNGHTLKQTGGGRIIAVHGKLVIMNGVITRSTSFLGDGAGVFLYHNDNEEVLSRLVMRGVTMTNCVASGDGGAIYAERDTQVLLENCTLRQNAAGGSGGAIYTFGGQTENRDTEKGEVIKDPWDKFVLISTLITDNTAGTSGAGVYYKYTAKGTSCFVAGTKVLMADGSEKAIEEVKEGDSVRTFDHEGGTNSTAAVFMTVKEPITTRVFVLTFADGYGVRCVLSHDFLMKSGDDACEYVCLSRQNAAEYVGKSFYAADGKWHELSSVTDGETVSEVYEIYTARHLNSYADGLLTVPADVAHVLNIYKLGANLKADAEQLAADIAAYGLADFAEISSKYGVSRAYYDAFGVQYGYVIVGKGLKTLAQMEALYRSTQEDAVSAQPKKTLPKLMTSSDEDDPLKDYPSSRLTLGAGTVVTNNLVSSKPNNIYLEKSSDYSLIALANDRTGICAGVTPQWTNGQITAFHYANPGDVALFRSDNADYAVWYEYKTGDDDGSSLQIAVGSQVVPPAVANATYETWKGDEIIAWNEGTTVEINTNVKVVYTADDGYLFDGSGATTKEVTVDASKSIATMTPPAAPFEAAASVTTNAVTTFYSTLTNAWADAISIKDNDADVLVTMLKDATVNETLVRPSPGCLTLDLNDKVLAYAGTSEACVVRQEGGQTMRIIDTAISPTTRYFTSDAKTGLWTLTDKETGLAVSGGLITGGRAGAVGITYGSGPHSISNVNFVGNRSASSGGAVSTTSMAYELKIAESAFFGNVASINGGAISANGPCEMSDCRVEANVAGGLGGGVYMKLNGSLVRTSVVGNKAGTGGGVYLTHNPSGCFPAGVKILLADGTEKNVENIVKGDLVATFDHLGGTNSSASVFYVYNGSGSLEAFTLTFASGAKLDITDRHDLLAESARKYVTVSSDNARQFIGKRFYSYATGGWDELVGVTPAKGGDAHYSIYVAGHANCVANGFLTVPDDKDCFVNVYELDEGLKADSAQLAADIATYGLATPADYPNIPAGDFEAGNIRFARIAIGKGLVTQAELLFWNEYDYGPVVTQPAPRLSAASLPMSAPVLAPTPSEPYLELGEETLVTNNVSSSGTDNVYLDRANGALIALSTDARNLLVGVTLSTGTGQFTTTDNVTASDFERFPSDNPEFAARYDGSGKFLKLGYAGVQVGDDAWAKIADGLCMVRGTGDMWSYDAASASPLWDYRAAITNLVVESGVTSVGSRFFENMWWLRDVQLGADVTNVAARAFKKCYGLTNVTSVASGAQTIGDYVFSGCHSLQAMAFADTPTFGTESYSLQAAIYMRDGIPEVYPIPAITMGGKGGRLWATNTLQDEDSWVDVTDKTPEERKSYHFFKIVMP